MTPALRLTPEQVRALQAGATPGPWWASEVTSHRGEVADSSETLATTWCGAMYGHGPANARLMAAAPDLAADWLAQNDALAAANATIARLTGELAAERGEPFALDGVRWLPMSDGFWSGAAFVSDDGNEGMWRPGVWKSEDDDQIVWRGEPATLRDALRAARKAAHTFGQRVVADEVPR